MRMISLQTAGRLLILRQRLNELAPAARAPAPRAVAHACLREQDRRGQRLVFVGLDHGQDHVAGRSGIQKLRDLSERCLPDRTPREKWSEQEVVRRAAQKSLRALGAATPQHINHLDNKIIRTGCSTRS